MDLTANIIGMTKDNIIRPEMVSPRLRQFTQFNNICTILYLIEYSSPDIQTT